MSGGGGSSGSNTVTTQVEKLPAELVPFHKDLLARGVYESLKGYEKYPYRRIAEIDPYEAGAQEAYAEMALAGTPQALADAQSGLREIAMGSPYERAIQGDATTQQLANLFQSAGETPDFYGPREPAQGQGLTRRIGPTQDELNKSINARMQSDPQFAEEYKQSLLTGSKTPLVEQAMSEMRFSDDVVPNTTGQRVTTQAEELPADLLPFYKDLLGSGEFEKIAARRAAVREQQPIDDRMREIMSLTDDLDATSNFSSLEEQQADPRVQRLQELQTQQVGERPQVSSEMERYMNPFQQTFIDRQKELAREEGAKQARDRGLAAAQAGSLGGGYEAIMQSEQERNLRNQLQDIQAAGDMANFQQARAAYESDRQNRMDVADLGLRGFEGLGRDVDRRGQAALSMADLSGQRQAQEIDRLANLESAGQRRRGLAQQGLDIGYKDFQRQQAFPREQLNLYSGLLRGVPVGPGQYSAVYGDQPTTGQQITGSLAGLAGLGMGAKGGWGAGWGGGG